MSITRLHKLTIYGRAADKETALAELQELGCLHLVPLDAGELHDALDPPTDEARQALRFLQETADKHTQRSPDQAFDPFRVEHEALSLQHRIERHRDRADWLRDRIRGLEGWGNIRFPDVEDLSGQRFWFYRIPHNRWTSFTERADLVYQVMRRDNRNRYVVVISPDLPVDIPGERFRVGKVPLYDLRRELEQIEADLEIMQVERTRLSRWAHAFAVKLAAVEDERARLVAARDSLDRHDIFAIQAWVPAALRAELNACCARVGLAIVATAVEDKEVPPTLLKNPEPIAGGEQLVRFYTTPNYHEWDPSSIVFFSFVLFFAMILGDAGYALLLGIVLLLVRKPLGRSAALLRFRRLLTAVVAGSLAWGLVVGSYFGVTPAPESLLGRLHVVDVNNFDMMIPLTICVGLLHILLANLVLVRRAWGRLEAIAPAGWAIALLGGGMLYLSGLPAVPPAWAKNAAMVLMIGGVLLIFVGSSRERVLWKRALAGLAGLTRVPNAFGDVLSYIRLFALGLASSSLAVSFNGLARQAGESESGFGFLVAIGILLIGHTVNFVLCIMSGVIHGLRLNFIEFFNWSLREEGVPFTPFNRREKELWNTSS